MTDILYHTIKKENYNNIRPVETLLIGKWPSGSAYIHNCNRYVY